MLYRVHLSDNLVSSPAHAFFLAQYHDLVVKGLTIPTELFDPDKYSVIYATASDKVVGCIAYYKTENSIRIVLSAIDDSLRGNGLYQLLRDRLEQYAIVSECTQISSWVHVKNKSMQRAAEKAGMKVSGIVMGKYLK